MSSNTPRVFITDGPAKWDFVTSFFTRIAERKELPFTVEDNPAYMSRLRMPKRKISLNILWVGLEDGSAEKFLIKGSMNSNTNFEGYYDSRTRRGWLKF